jgi:hypothetical protein
METKQNDYITIAEYAKIRGVSVSSVYKRLGGTLKQYYKEIDGMKFLSAKILVEEGITPPVERVEEGLKNEPTPPAVLVALEVLEKQLAEKDQQIRRLQEEAEDLRRSNAEKDVFIQEQAGKMMLLLEQAQELNRNNQILLGVEKGITPRVEEGITPPVEPQGNPGEEETPASQEEAPPADPAGTEPRRGFWGRLFGGKKK